jgi:hypothetical protein
MNAKQPRPSTSPQRGEVGARSAPGEGDYEFVSFVPPHPSPLPKGERESRCGKRLTHRFIKEVSA